MDNYIDSNRINHTSMNKNKGGILWKEIIFLTAFFFAGILFSSCNAELELSVDKNGNANVKFNSAMGTALENLISSVSGQNTEISAGATQPIFDAQEIENAFLLFGFSNVKALVKDDSKVSVTAKIEADSEKKEAAAGKSLLNINEAISFSAKKIKLTFSPEILQRIIESSGEDFQSYADLFMAPVFTGEAMSAGEYKELLSSVYGNAVANELVSSDFKIRFFLPSGKKAVYTVPFAELLTLTEKKEFIVEE